LERSIPASAVLSVTGLEVKEEEAYKTWKKVALNQGCPSWQRYLNHWKGERFWRIGSDRIFGRYSARVSGF
jgi:hypothetical protein